MLKYVDTAITFAEVPDEISLCINISNCPNKCPGCHSPYLQEDTGKILTTRELYDLISRNQGITCLCFMGGDSSPEWVNFLAEWVKDTFPELLVAWYSGNKELHEDIDLANFDFVKLGPYLEEKGPLNKRTTNQQFFRIVPLRDKDGHQLYGLENVTYLFWKDEAYRDNNINN